MSIQTTLLKLGYSILSTFDNVNPIIEYKFLNSVDLSRISEEIKGKSLDEVVGAHPLGKRLYIDATTLRQETSARQHDGLRKNLVDYVSRYKNTESYGGVPTNQLEDAFNSTLTYIELLKSLVDAKLEKTEKLQVAVIKAFIQRLGEGYYAPFVPYKDSKYFHLWERATNRTLPRKELPQTDYPPPQQPL